MPRYLAALLLLVAAVASAQQALPPQRIASLNLCTDLLLLELVPRERIVSLTYWAEDPDLSYLAGQVGDIHLNHSLAEEIVPLQPDLVLAGQFSDTQVIALLRELGVRVEVLDVPLTLDGMRSHLLDVGRLVGESEAAAGLANRIERRLAWVADAALATESRRPLAAVYGPQGVSPGTDTLMDDLLTLAGYRNLAAEQGIASYGTLSLETLVVAQPDVLVIDNLSSNRNSIAHHALRHPALRGQFEIGDTLDLSASLTACVGPQIVEAAEQLSAWQVRWSRRQ